MIGPHISIAGEHLRVAEIAATLSSVLGEEVRYVDVPADVFRSFGFPGADNMGNMIQFKRDFEEDHVGARDLEVVRSLNPDLDTFEEWARANKNRSQV